MFFFKFLNTSYLSKALTLNPPLYEDVLKVFWRTTICETMALDDGTSKITITCKIGENWLVFGEAEVNETFKFTQEKYDAEAT